MQDGKIMNKLKILYEDNHIIVVIKEAGILSQKDITNNEDMLTIVKSYIKEKYNKPGNVYLGLVHRLDRMVAGIMVFAKTSKAASRLSEQIKNKKFKKNYLCVVKGIPTKNEDILIDYLTKNEKTNISRVTNEKSGKLSKLKYKVINSDKNKNLSLLEIDLLTGRHHQIRVQLSSRGYPIYGDNKYDKNPIRANIKLYAYKLVFIHPTTKEKLEFINYPSGEIWDSLLI